MITKLTLLNFAAILLLSSAADAELFKYTDSNGGTHYVDNLKKVPEAYREQVKDLKDIPGISRVTPGRKNIYEKKHYESRSLKGRGSLEVFVADWCGYCKALEKDLKKEGIAYTRYNVETSAKGKRMWKKLGGGVPFSRVNGSQIIRGYALAKIKAALGRK